MPENFNAFKLLTWHFNKILCPQMADPMENKVVGRW